MSTPMACSASRSGALKCSAQESWHPSGSGTFESGRPMCSLHAGSTPAGTFRNRSKSSQTCRCRTGTPRRASSSATKCTVRNSRRLPRWTRPEGLAPEETVTIGAPSPACRTASSAALVTQSTGAPSRAPLPLATWANATGTSGRYDQRVRRRLHPPGAVPLRAVDLAVGAAPELLARHGDGRAPHVDHVVPLGVPAHRESGDVAEPGEGTDRPGHHDVDPAVAGVRVGGQVGAAPDLGTVADRDHEDGLVEV